jgi:oligopeptide transport system ATP-binding protein
MDNIIELQNVSKYYPVPVGGVLRRRYQMLKAVDGVTFSVLRGTCLGIAGESGSGKTTVDKLMLLLEKPTGGQVLFEGRDIHGLSRTERMWYRTRVQAVFQDAASSLSPRMYVSDIVSEPMEVQHKELSKQQIMSRVAEIMQLVGLGAVGLRRYPHELSGGQKQRVAIARALILEPSLVILDEPVSALDVSIRAQILNLLADIQEKRNLTYVIIAHDLAMLRQVTSHTIVMYLGKIMEMGETDKVFDNPTHPYTLSLLAAVPRPEPRRGPRQSSVAGEIGNPLNPPPGCRFSPRCPMVREVCRTVEPQVTLVDPYHSAACHVVAGNL